MERQPWIRKCVSAESLSFMDEKTIDGKNSAKPVDMENPLLFSGFYASQVVQDVFHQPDVLNIKCFPLHHIPC